MRVTVKQGYQINHDGKVRQAGESFDAPEPKARRWVQAGYAVEAKAVSGSKNKAVTSAESPNKGLAGRTVDELRKLAAERDVEGRSSMSKDELVKALGGD